MTITAERHAVHTCCIPFPVAADVNWDWVAVVVPESLSVSATVVVVNALSELQIGSVVEYKDCRAARPRFAFASVNVSQPGQVVTPSPPTVATSSRR